jgi:hypothetical protein
MNTEPERFLQVGRVTPRAPSTRLPKPGAHGVTRPASTNRFKASTFVRVIPLTSQSPIPKWRHPWILK